MTWTKINMAVSVDSDISLFKFKASDYTTYTTYNSIKKYTYGNSYIVDVFYYSKINNKIITTKLGVEDAPLNSEYKYNLNSDDFDIDLNSIKFDGKSEFRLISSSLIYIPSQQSTDYTFFFLISNKEINKLLTNQLTVYTDSLFIADDDFNIINKTGLETDFNIETLASQDLTGKSYFVFNNGSIVHFNNKLSQSGLRFICIANIDFIIQQMNLIKKSSYYVVLLIILVCIFISFLSIYFNYVPIHKLISSIEQTLNKSKGEMAGIKFIQTAFYDTLKENSNLTDKMQHYRIMMQKSILENLVNTNNYNDFSLLDIDGLFNDLTETTLHVLAVSWENSIYEVDYIYSELVKYLGSESNLLMIDSLSYNLNVLISTPKNKNLSLQLIEDFLVDKMVKVALSDCTINPMNISRIYNNALQALKLANEKEQFSIYSENNIKITKQSDVQYPYEMVDLLTKNLGNFNLIESKNIIKNIINYISVNNSSEFFAKSILLDTCNLVFSVIRETDIKFEKFSDAYLELIYLCRNGETQNVLSDILNKFLFIIELFESEMNKHNDEVTELKEFILENYMSSNFSLTLMGDSFNLSPTNISFIFKKKIGLTISEYVWQLRLAKAKELLIETDKPVKDIINYIGFNNASSFIRKFKTCENITPIAYREMYKKN